MDQLPGQTETAARVTEYEAMTTAAVIEKCQIVWVPLNSVHLNPENPRLNEPAVEAVMRSIARFGFRVPLVVNRRTGLIEAGNTRWKAAQRMGLPEVPVIFADDDELTALAFALADNRTAEIATWDEPSLAGLLQRLEAAGELDSSAFSHDDLGSLIAKLDMEAAQGREETWEPPEELPAGPTRAQPGEVWQLGRHRLLCGDATDPANWQRLMGGEVAHAICTDPPYAINYLGGRAAQEERIGAKRRGAEEANSDTYRNRAWDWYRSTAYTRLEPGGALILIMTRWHEDDLAEAAKSGEQWHVISLPALAEANDALGRQPGEALWPARYPVEQLEQIRASIGPYWWQALYQQRPSPPEGALFRAEWWRYWEPETLPTRWDEMLLSVDASYKARSDNSYTAIGVWGRKGADCYLIHQWRKQCGFAEARDAVAATAKQYPQARIILIEDKANGRAIIESLQAVVAGIVPVDPKGGKFSRAQAVSPMVEQGHVWLPQPARLPWVQEFLAEARTFPVGLHDDQVDQMTQALQWWIWVKDQPLPPQPELTIPQQRAAMADASDRRPVGAGRSPRWRMRQ